MNFHDMIVYGVSVPADLQRKALERFISTIQKHGLKSARHLEAIFEQLGLPEWNGLCTRGIRQEVSHRAADRLLQKARKLGILYYHKDSRSWALNDQPKPLT